MVVWKPIKDYEQLYEISNTGKVRRKDSIVTRSNGRQLPVKGGEMQLRDNGMGYLRVKLCKNNKSRRVLIHRLIAEHFIPQPDGMTIINHRDGNKQNNHISNLEWTTQKENIRHARETGLVNIEKWKKSIAETGRRVIKDLHIQNSRSVINTETGEKFSSIIDAAKALGVCRMSLGKKLRGQRKNNTSLVFENK